MLSTMGMPVTQKQAEMALAPQFADLSQLSSSAKARSNKRNKNKWSCCLVLFISVSDSVIIGLFGLLLVAFLFCIPMG